MIWGHNIRLWCYQTLLWCYLNRFYNLIYRAANRLAVETLAMCSAFWDKTQPRMKLLRWSWRWTLYSISIIFIFTDDNNNDDDDYSIIMIKYDYNDNQANCEWDGMMTRSDFLAAGIDILKWETVMMTMMTMMMMMAMMMIENNDDIFIGTLYHCPYCTFVRKPQIHQNLRAVFLNTQNYFLLHTFS